MSGGSESNSDESVVLQERERIVAALTDRVVRRLFEVGMGLSGIADAIDDPSHSQELLRHIDVLDSLIADIRGAVFEYLPDAGQDPSGGLQARILWVIDYQLSGSSGYVNTRFTGDLNELIEDQLADEIVDIIREVLTTRSRTDGHAVDIDVALVDGSIKVKISGQGLHIGASADRLLAGIQGRAAARGATVHFAATDTGATQLTWQAWSEALPGRSTSEDRSSEAADDQSASDGLSSTG